MEGDKPSPEPSLDDIRKILSPTEYSIFLALLGEESQKQIAQRLGKSYDTCHQHIKSIYRKLDVNARHELQARWVSKLGDGPWYRGRMPRSARAKSAVAAAIALAVAGGLGLLAPRAGDVDAQVPATAPPAVLFGVGVEPAAGPEAKQADQQLQQELLDAEERYLADILAARQRYVARLEEAMKLALARQDTNQIVSLQTELEKAREHLQATQDRQGLAPAIAQWRQMMGRYRSAEAPYSLFVLTLDADGQPKLAGDGDGSGSHRWAYDAGQQIFLFDWSNNKYVYAIGRDPSDGGVVMFTFTDTASGWDGRSIPSGRSLRRPMVPLD